MKQLHLVIALCFVLLTSSLFAQQNVQEADARFDAGDYAAAISFYQVIIRAYQIQNRSTSDIEKKLSLAMECKSVLKTAKDYYNQGYYVTASDCFKAIKKLNPNDPNVDDNLILCEYGLVNKKERIRSGKLWIELPTNKMVYTGVADMDKGNSIKIKRIEIDFSTSSGYCFYSETPLDLEIAMSAIDESIVNVTIKETNPGMTRHSELGGKTSSIYKGVLNSDGCITGRGVNWRGQQFTFKFSPLRIPKSESQDKSMEIDKQDRNEYFMTSSETESINQADEDDPFYQMDSNGLRTIYTKEATVRVGEKVFAQLSEGRIEKWEISANAAPYVAATSNGSFTALKTGNVSIWGYVGSSPKLFKLVIVGTDTYVAHDRAPYNVKSKEFSMYVGDQITASLAEGAITSWEIKNNNKDYAIADGRVLRAIKEGHITAWGYVGPSPKLFHITILKR